MIAAKWIKRQRLNETAVKMRRACTLQLLAANIGRRPCASRIRPLHGALWGQDGWVTFTDDSDSHGDWGWVVRLASGWEVRDGPLCMPQFRRAAPGPRPLPCLACCLRLPRAAAGAARRHVQCTDQQLLNKTRRPATASSQAALTLFLLAAEAHGPFCFTRPGRRM